MNASGFLRGLMSKNLSGEDFIKHVAHSIEKQLQEWDEHYEVFLMKLADYEFMIKNKDTYYHVQISQLELETLQNKSPFSLDKRIWLDLKDQGLPIIMGLGDYLDKAL